MKTHSNDLMKRAGLSQGGAVLLIALLFLLNGAARATTVTNYVPDGQFESPNGDVGPWQNMFGGDTINFLSTGGNPNGCLQISDGGSYGGVAYVNPPASNQPTLASLGLVAGQTYTFVMDMQIVSGSSIGGLKLESWTANNIISDSGNMYPLSGTANWTTYSFTYKIAAGATYLNVVPLWGPNSTVNFDNIGVVVTVPGTPVSVAITGPTNSQVVYSNFTINATASVNPGTVTNVAFYLDNTLLGATTNSPFGYLALGVSAGSHALKAVATDSGGNQATSSVVNVTVTSAAIPVFSAYEPFNYPQGQLVSGTPTTAAGFTGNWSCGAAGNIVAGLMYPGLPTGNNALESAGAYQLESLTNAPSGVSNVWASFIFEQNGDNGGNRDGFALVDGNGRGIMFAYQQNQAAIGNPALTTISSFTGVGAQLTPFSATAQTYAANNFYVLKLAYNGSALSSVSVYTNPTNSPGQTTPPAPDFTVTTGLGGIGVLSAVGLVHQAGIPITLDEIRLGTSYSSVVGSGGSGTIPTTLALSVSAGNEVSWNAVGTDSYQPQSSTDGVNWNNLGSELTGASVSAVFDPAPVAYYQILDYTEGLITNAVPNGSFEIIDDSYLTEAQSWYGVGTGTDGNGNTISQYVTNSWGGTVQPVDGTNLFYMEVTTPATGTVAPPNVFLQSVDFPLPAGGVTYPVTFSECSPVNISGNPQYEIQYLDGNYSFISSSGYQGIGAGVRTSWVTISNNFAAPVNAAYMQINFIVPVGAANGEDVVILLDNVRVNYALPGPTVALTPKVQAAAEFSATVDASGSPATAATGFITFETNGVVQSAGLLNYGSVNGAPAVVPANYTITAMYTGDNTYQGSTNNLVIGTGVNPNPTNIVASVAANVLTLSWPADHTGWTLQAQTNSLRTGITANWYPVAGSAGTNQMSFTVNPTNPSVFYRLKY